jgi:hypothetical protein
MSFLPAKNLIFLQDSQNNFKFLVWVRPFQSCRIQARRRPQVRTLWGPMASKFLPGVSAAAPSVFPGHNFEFDFYWRQLPPLS